MGTAKLDDVRKIRLGFDLGSHGPLRLIVERKDGTTSAINANVFSGEAIRAVLDLGQRLAAADADGLQDGVVMKAIRKARSKT